MISGLVLQVLQVWDGPDFVVTGGRMSALPRLKSRVSGRIIFNLSAPSLIAAWAGSVAKTRHRFYVSAWVRSAFPCRAHWAGLVGDGLWR